MGEWDNTTFVQRNSEQDVLEVLIYLFEKEGFQQMEVPPKLTSREKRDLQYENEIPTRAICWIPGVNDGWGILKTAPFELFVRPAPGDVHPRLTTLARHLSCHALSIHLYDGADRFTVESNCEAECLIRGAPYEEMGDLMDGGFSAGLRASQSPPMASSSKWEPYEQLFVLWPEMNDAIGELADYPAERFEQIGMALTGRPMSEWDNGVMVDALLQSRPWPIEGSRCWYFRRV